jgi:PKD repeat protein
MAYSSCTEFFTTQQKGRMHCWTNDMLSSWVANVRIEADVQVGKVPFDVNFNGLTAKSVNSWDWDFGDGGNAASAQPVHTYSTPGLYDVEVTIQTNDGPFTTKRSPMIAAHADSVRAVNIAAAPGDTAFVNIYCRNYVPVEDLKIPFTWAGPLGLALVDFRTTGLRSASMGVKAITSYVPSNEQAAYRLAKGAGSALMPGAGPILTLVFIVPEGAEGGPNPIVIESYTGQTLQFQSEVGSYDPTGLSGQVTLNLGICGDVNGNDQGPTIQDLIYLVGYLFNNGPEPPNTNLADVNHSSSLTVADVIYLVGYLFNAGPAPNCP